MLPDPLHPALVHLPLALAVLAPLLALAGALAIRRRWLPARSWLAVVAIQALLVGSAWAALETGEEEEEVVEDVVRESVIHEHEERAERFFGIGIATALVSAAGLLGGGLGGAGRAATVVLGAAVLAAAVSVGHSGGELVYRHGAASVYVERAAAGAGDGGAAVSRREHDDDEDDDD